MGILKYICILPALWFTTTTALCQDTTIEQCGTMPYLYNSLATSTRQALLHKRYEKLIVRSYSDKKRTNDNLIVIPVIVHVVWKQPEQNISDAQVLSQINVLNEDYRRMRGTRGYNNDPIGADTHIEFRLAQIDQNGDRCLGIERIQTNVDSFRNTGPEKDDVKFSIRGGANAWNSNNYLNIWVCNLAQKNGRVLMGYATFPGAPAEEDGVVILYKAFGDSVGAAINYLGRTATHEIGHWLNLYHTFQGGCANSNCLNDGDKVCDTPPVSDPSYGCPVGKVSCGESTLIRNYMDYSNHACRNLVTEGQNYRMRVTLDYIRKGLISSPALENHHFQIFGNHTGGYRYVLDGDFYLLGTGLYPGFVLEAGSSILVNSRGGHQLTLGPNVKILKGGIFRVLLDANP